MIKTKFFDDTISYYHKAKLLQEGNLALKEVETGDPLMTHVKIYDSTHRKYAGFSKVLQDIMGKRESIFEPRISNYSNKLTINELHFLFLFHRFTGSGASFEPKFLPDGLINPKEHGYCNSKVEHLAIIASLNRDNSFNKMREYIVQNKEPMCTSKGNQGPSLKNPFPEKYRLSIQYYFDNFAELFVEDYLNFLMMGDMPEGIKSAVDFCLNWHSQKKFKRWNFVLTAFVMDTAEYYPNLVDPSSHCYYGSNCIKTMDLCFIKEPSDKEKGNDWYEKCMTEWVSATGGNPYDLEDVPGCDYIRYLREHIPKGYEHLSPEQRLNNSILKVNGEYPEDIQQRINEVLG